jgi:hypothetical protein
MECRRAAVVNMTTTTSQTTTITALYITLFVTLLSLSSHHRVAADYVDPWDCVAEAYSGECCYPSSQPMQLPTNSCSVGK